MILQSSDFIKLKYYYSYFIIGFVLFAFSFDVLAKAPSNSFVNALQNKHLIIPVFHEPPWIIVKGEQVSGSEFDILQLMSKDLGFSFELVSCPWARCLWMMESGQADFMIGLLKRPEREAYIHYIEPHYMEAPSKYFYTRKGESHRLKEYKDLNKLVIGMIRNRFFFSKFNEDKNLTKIYVNNDRQLIQMLLHGRIDTFVSYEKIAISLSEMKVTQLIEKSLFKVTENENSFVGVSKKSWLVDYVDILAAYTKEKVEQGVFKKYLLDNRNTIMPKNN